MPDMNTGLTAVMSTQLFNVTSDAIIAVDGAQCILEFNRGAELLFGYSAPEVFGKPLDLIIPARFVAAHQHHVSSFAHGPDASRRMGERRTVLGLRRDGSEFPAEAGITKLQDGERMIFVVMLRDVSERKRLEDEAHTKSNQLAILNERNRLARDLHDSVTQSLFSASIMADVLPKLWRENQEKGEQQLEDIRLLTRGALAEMRSLLLEMRPNALIDNKLSDLIKQLAESTASRCRMKIEVTADEQHKLPAEVQVAFYRIAQEALHNIAKHSQASAASVQLSLLLRSSMMLIHDDGRGFVFTGIDGTHLGLRIMRERSDEVGAKLHIESEAGTGTDVLVTWSNER